MVNTMAKTPSDHLLYSLEELVPYDFEKFKFKLQNISLEKVPPRIPRGQLQTARPVKLANLMIAHYGEKYAVRLTLQVLKAINQHLLAEELHRAIGPGKQSPCPLLYYCNCWLFMGWYGKYKNKCLFGLVHYDLGVRSPRSTMTLVTLAKQILFPALVFGAELIKLSLPMTFKKGKRDG